VRLEQAAFSLSRSSLIDQLVLPLMTEVGRRWETGAFRVAHEHLASSAVRSLLGRMLTGSAQSESAPLLISTTLARQIHEIGALATAVAAATEGWNVTYLGPNLPAEEILAAVTRQRPRVLALSIVYPGDDPRLAEELEMLGRHLPADIRLLVGGRAASGYLRAIESAGGKHLAAMEDFRTELRALHGSNL